MGQFFDGERCIFKEFKLDENMSICIPDFIYDEFINQINSTITASILLGYTYSIGVDENDLLLNFFNFKDDDTRHVCVKLNRNENLELKKAILIEGKFLKPKSYSTKDNLDWIEIIKIARGLL